MFLNLPDEKIFCASNKVMFDAGGFRVRMSNKFLNPEHIKYSMDPSGEIHCRFERHFESIHTNPKIEKQLEKAEIKLSRLRST
jgi:hypothetical protein